MKKIITFSIIFVLFFGLNLSKAQAPDKVKNTFKQKFATATNVKWSKENAKEYLREHPEVAKEIEAKIRANAKQLSEGMTAPRSEDD